jgi:hypothetical protein
MDLICLLNGIAIYFLLLVHTKKPILLTRHDGMNYEEWFSIANPRF